MRTANSVTPLPTTRAAMISLVVICAVYVFIFAFGIFYIYRLLRDGPIGRLPPLAASPNRPMSVIDRHVNAPAGATAPHRATEPLPAGE